LTVTLPEPPATPAKLPKARIHFRSWPDFAEFLTQDGGAEGLFVRVGRPPSVGTELRIEFVFPDLSDLTLRARVVHRVTEEEAGAEGRDSGMGVQFTDMSAEQAVRLQSLIANVDVAKGIVEAEGRSLQPPPEAVPSLTPAARAHKQLADAYSLLDRSRFDAAERIAADLLAAQPDDEVRVLLLLVQARRMASCFDFEGALGKYGAVLELVPEHEEATGQVRQLHSELAHSADLFERVFGSKRD
jgi:Tfp pilus assembly protein PilZ